jgi:transposase-like protein/Zn ribbon nucleic-acid-binding protein
MTWLIYPENLMDFQKMFQTDKDCSHYLYQCRWPAGFVCPKCNKKSEKSYSLENYKRYECPKCGHQVSITAGTVMHNTKTALTIWFWAAYLVSTLTPGISALQLKKQLGIKRYETAYQILQKLRSVMIRPDRDKIRGVLEVDETYIGSSQKGKRGRGAFGKILVAGALEVLSVKEKKQRVGRLRLSIIPDASGKSLEQFIQDNIEKKSILITDDWNGYNGINNLSYKRKIVSQNDLDHIHITFGNLKTWLEGTHHGVSSKHLQAYLNEFVFRHNRRKNQMASFQRLLGLSINQVSPTYDEIYTAGNLIGWVHPGKTEP